MPKQNPFPIIDFARRVSKKAGLPPGSLIYVGADKQHDVNISLIDYSETDFHESKISLEESFPYKDSDNISWINVDGVHRPQIIADIAGHFGFHMLLQEDLVNTRLLPKAEEFDDHLFLS